MIRISRRAATALFIAAACLAGCGGIGSGMRPVIAIDGESMDVNDPVSNGRALLVTGQYGLAIDALSRVLHDDPSNVRALNLLAEAYDRVHRYDLADRYHAQAVEIAPNSVAALNNWGYSLLVRGDREHGIGLLQRAAAIDGTQPTVLANLQLAGVDTTSAPFEAAAKEPAAPSPVMVPVSRHVVVVKKRVTLVRLAPGVQMLVTEKQPEEAPLPIPLQSSLESDSLPYVVTEQKIAGDDNRIRNLRALQYLLDPTGFNIVADVDDFITPGGLALGTRPASGPTIQNARAM